MKKYNYILIGSFCILLGVPLILQIVGVTVGTEVDENRVRAEFPLLTFSKTKKAKTALKKAKASYTDVVIIKKGFESYVNDNFALKPILFDTYAGIQEDIFKENPKPEKVVEGNNEWAFLGDKYSNVIIESKGLQNYNAENLDQLTISLTDKKNWLAERGIDFYIAIAPNKHTVYGENLPIVQGQKSTKSNQLQDVATTNNIKFVDLTEAILKHKNEGLLYHKRNSHWNDLGAFWATDSLLRFMKADYPQIQLLDTSLYEKIDDKPLSNDLDKLMRKKTKSVAFTFKTEEPFANPIAAPVPVPVSYNGKPENYIYSYSSTVNNLTILVFRDSFSTAMLPYFKEGFGTSHFVWSHKFDQDLIEKIKPDIVLYEIVERDIDFLLRK